MAEALAGLVEVSRWGRLRCRSSGWWVLHSVPVGTGNSDIDHIVGGPPGLFTLNTKHHRTGRVEIDGDEIVVNRRATQHVGKARAEAERAGRVLRDALSEAGMAGLAGRVVVRPVLAFVGARLLGRGRPGGVIVATPATLPVYLRSMPEQFDASEVGAVYELARARRPGPARGDH